MYLTQSYFIKTQYSFGEEITFLNNICDKVCFCLWLKINSDFTVILFGRSARSISGNLVKILFQHSLAKKKNTLVSGNAGGEKNLH